MRIFYGVIRGNRSLCVNQASWLKGIGNLTDNEYWHPGQIALLTTKKRNGEHAAQTDLDIDAYWEDLWADEDAFYCTIGGFKGLERPGQSALCWNVSS